MSIIDPSFKSKLYHKLQTQLPEADEGLGPFNPIYEEAARRLSIHPWLYITPASLAASVIAWLIAGQLFLKIANLLQYGFLP
jgi:hypothetical protein